MKLQHPGGEGLLNMDATEETEGPFADASPTETFREE